MKSAYELYRQVVFKMYSILRPLKKHARQAC